MGAAGGWASSRAGVRNKKQFNRMMCPYLHELHRTNRVTLRQELVELTVPGMRNHVRRVHGEDAYRRMKWPPIYRGARWKVKPGTIPAMNLNELRQEAVRLGVNHHRMGKEQLRRMLIWAE